MRKIAWILPLALFVAVVTAAVGGFWHFTRSPLNPPGADITFTLAPGSSLKTTLKTLSAENVLSPLQSQLFHALVRLKKAQTTLKAGEYLIPANITPNALLEKMVKGDVVRYALTFAEGSMFSQIIQIMADHPAIKPTLSGKKLEEVMGILGETGFPEGLFFPDTYYFTANMTDVALLKRARETMRERLNTAWQKRDPDLAVKTPYEALILASIIEKEAKIPEERFLISGVFQRRLAQHMRLQADPTVIYGLQGTLTGPLTRENLKQDTPYNTYLHKGLPPTPIALPGMNAIEAALHPDKGNALYFMAKGDGSHHFSATLKEHNEAVLKYRKDPVAQ